MSQGWGLGLGQVPSLPFVQPWDWTLGYQEVGPETLRCTPGQSLQFIPKSQWRGDMRVLGGSTPSTGWESPVGC